MREYGHLWCEGWNALHPHGTVVFANHSLEVPSGGGASGQQEKEKGRIQIEAGGRRKPEGQADPAEEDGGEIQEEIGCPEEGRRTQGGQVPLAGRRLDQGPPGDRPEDGQQGPLESVTAKERDHDPKCDQYPENDQENASPPVSIRSYHSATSPSPVPIRIQRIRSSPNFRIR